MQINNLPASSFANAVWAATTRNLTSPSGVWSETTRNLTNPSGVWSDASRTLTNPSGVWSDAARTLTVGGGAIVGATLQPIGSTGSVNLNTVASTNAVNFTGPAAGALINMGFVLGTSLGTGTASYEIDVVIDGTTFVLPMCSSSQNWNANGIAICSFISGLGAATPSQCLWHLPIQFTTSLRVSLNVTASTLSAGAATLSVLWGHS